MSSKPVSIPRVEVFPGRLRILVRLSGDVPHYTSEDMIAKVSGAYPTLMHHSCINSKGPVFGDVAASTSVPHLLEHLVIAEQVSIASRRMANMQAASIADSSVEATFVGTTEWVRKPTEGMPSEALIEVSFVDDLEALEAVNRALEVLNASL